jgi:hypothetical protein
MDTAQLPVHDGVFDIIIVGAGPAGLAVASRLREQCPAALFTDEEHRRFQWLRRYGRNVSIKHVHIKGGRVSYSQRPHAKHYRMTVLDDSDEKWLGRWNRLFGAYGITHLRSHMLWHVDPRDRDSLLAHAHEKGREDEMLEMRGCVGREISKHMRKKRSKKPGEK